MIGAGESYAVNLTGLFGKIFFATLTVLLVYKVEILNLTFHDSVHEDIHHCIFHILLSIKIISTSLLQSFYATASNFEVKLNVNAVLGNKFFSNDRNFFK